MSGRQARQKQQQNKRAKEQRSTRITSINNTAPVAKGLKNNLCNSNSWRKNLNG